MEFQRYATGEWLNLDPTRRLGTGGEAHIYAVRNESTFAAKVYHAPTIEREQKLLAMINHPPDDPMAREGHRSIAWPIDLLVTLDGTRQVVGFLMPRVSGIRNLIDVYNPRTRRTLSLSFNTDYLLWTAHNVAAGVGALHDRGYVVGDVNESNILVNESALVTLVDTDSFQVRDPRKGVVYRCPVGKPDYTPPELQDRDFIAVDRTPQHDHFGLGVLIFMLLMEGWHPFAGRFQGSSDDPPIEARIASGHFPYSRRRGTPYTPPPLAPSFNILHPSLQDLFICCFEEGHTNPQMRPDARSWQRALRQAAEALVSCNINDQHRYSNHLSHCPWCERTIQLRGLDPFPSKESVRNGQYRQPIIQPPPTPFQPTQRQPTQQPAGVPTLHTTTPPLRSHTKPNIWLWFALSFGLLSLIPLLHLWAGLAAVICGLVGRRRAQIGIRNKWVANATIGLGSRMAKQAVRQEEFLTVVANAMIGVGSSMVLLVMLPIMASWIGERLQTQESPAKPATRITNSIGMEFVLIPAGTFTMGSPDSDTDAYSEEKPAHQVTISKPFYMGKYEVTQAQWKAIMGNNPSYLKSDDRPVENVSWEDVQQFIQKLNQREKQASGIFCRLPTEAEWEYAARAGTTTSYSFGDDPAQLKDYAWYLDNADIITTPPVVGEKEPNPWGLYDKYRCKIKLISFPREVKH